MNWILAQQQLPEEVSAIRDQFQRSVPLGRLMGDGLLLLFLIALPFLGMFLLRRFSRRRDVDRPESLFRKMIAKLALDTQERALLRRVADDLQLSHPTVLLLAPSIFENQTSAWLHADEENRRDYLPTFEAMKPRLFSTGDIP